MKDDDVYINHIRDAISKIEEYTHILDYDAFLEKDMVQDAVIRQIEIIGEASKSLSEAFKERKRKIPWKDIAGMRDKLIHAYFGVDISAVWNTVKKDIPLLKKELTSS